MIRHILSSVQTFMSATTMLLIPGLFYLGLFPFFTANVAANATPNSATNAIEHGSAFVQITDATIRAVPPGAANTAVYFTIKNLTNAPMVLERVTLPIAGRVELHKTEIDGDISRMVRQKSVTIAPNSKLNFNPGGLHVMLMGMKKAPMQGDIIPLTLYFNEDRNVTVKAVVKMQMDMSQETHGHHMY